MFISEAFAQAGDAAAAQGSVYGTLIQLGLIFVIFYVLLIRPQQKKIKQHEAMLMAIKKGDKVITGGGIYGKVVKAEDGGMELVVEIADGLNPNRPKTKPPNRLIQMLKKSTKSNLSRGFSYV